MKNFIRLIILLVFLSSSSCTEKQPSIEKVKEVAEVDAIQLDNKAANNLIKLPLACVLQEYPNAKLQIKSNQKIKERLYYIVILLLTKYL